jgi:hypothetical protein
MIASYQVSYYLPLLIALPYRIRSYKISAINTTSQNKQRLGNWFLAFLGGLFGVAWGTLELELE